MLFLLVCVIAPLLAAALVPHPRLILTPSRLLDVQGFIHNNSQAASYYAHLQAQGAYVLTTTPLPRPPENATDILMASRSVLTRVYVTALLYRLTGNDTFAARCVAELLSIVTWADWDIEKHALDTGELSHAAAIGLDWTYDWLALHQPSAIPTLVAGIVAKSGIPFQAAYRAHTGWTCEPSNWAVVTNAGVGLAALAIEGEEGVPGWVSELLSNATRGVLCSVGAGPGYGSGLAPEGGWWEGPIYSGYALRYMVPFATALATAHSNSYLLTFPGLSTSASYHMSAMDGNYSYFNWADSEINQETLAMLLGVAAAGGAGKGDAPGAFTLRDRLDKISGTLPPSAIDTGDQACMEYPHALLYFTALGTLGDRAALPLDVAYPAKKVALLRGSWVDANTSFLGLKATNCSWNHGDNDHGTFVYSGGGQRWVVDTGVENYGLPGYFGNERYTYYRKNSRGANTLAFNGLLAEMGDCGGYTPPHTPLPPGPSTTFLGTFSSRSGRQFPDPENSHPLPPCALSPDEQACVSIDLTPAYAGVRAGGMANVTRRFALLVSSSGGSDGGGGGGGGSSIWGGARVDDTWVGGSSVALVNATASFHTLAKVTVGGSSGATSALLELGGVSATLTVTPQKAGECSGLSITAVPIDLPPPQYKSVGLTRVDVSVGGVGGGAGGVDGAGLGCGGWRVEVVPIPF